MSEKTQTWVNKLAFADYGHFYMTSSTPATSAEVYFGAIQILEDSVISYKTWVNGTLTTFTGISVPAGDVIYGILTEVYVASGRVRIYNRH